MSSIHTMSTFQMRRKKNIKKTVPFTMMVCGASGTGRSSFVNSLCGRTVLNSGSKDAALAGENGATSASADDSILSSDSFDKHVYSNSNSKDVRIRQVPVEIEEEDGTRIALTVVDTPGFGDNIDNTRCFSEIMQYIEDQYDEVLAEESRIRRNPRFRDNRVHVALYFIEPTGHGLRELDVEMMRRLGSRVNVIPIIGRADQLTVSEKAMAKRMIMEDIAYYKIPIFSFPFDEEDDDEETAQENMALRDMLPFAMVCGNAVMKNSRGEHVSVRQYPWGVVEIDNPDHSDFSTVRSTLLGSHLVDLKEITHDYWYEHYRTERLSTEHGDSNVRESKLMLGPEDLASQSSIIKEAQLAREEQKIQEFEERVRREIEQRKAELAAREKELRDLEEKMGRQRLESPRPGRVDSPALSTRSHASAVPSPSEQRASNGVDVSVPAAPAENGHSIKQEGDGQYYE